MVRPDAHKEKQKRVLQFCYMHSFLGRTQHSTQCHSGEGPELVTWQKEGENERAEQGNQA